MNSASGTTSSMLLPVDDRVDVDLQARVELRFQLPETASAIERLAEVARNAAQPVVGRLEAVERQVDVQLEVAVSGQAVVRDLDDPARLQPVGR